MSYVDDLMARLAAAAAAELEAIGGEIEADFKGRCGELFPPPSEPGAPPHQRSGGYREGFSHDVTPAAGGGGGGESDQVKLDVGNPTALSVWLEYGTRNPDGSPKMLPRPHFGPVFQDWRDRVPQRLAEAMSSSQQ